MESSSSILPFALRRKHWCMILDNSLSGSHASHSWNLLWTWIEGFLQDPDHLSFYICREPEPPPSWQGKKYIYVGQQCSTLGINSVVRDATSWFLVGLHRL